jgi:hypothetical protein
MTPGCDKGHDEPSPGQHFVCDAEYCDWINGNLKGHNTVKKFKFNRIEHFTIV